MDSWESIGCKATIGAERKKKANQTEELRIFLRGINIVLNTGRKENLSQKKFTIGVFYKSFTGPNKIETSLKVEWFREQRLGIAINLI